MEDARPLSVTRITASGRKRFLSYLAVLEQVLLDAGGQAESDDARVRGLLNLQSR